MLYLTDPTGLQAVCEYKDFPALGMCSDFSICLEHTSFRSLLVAMFLST